jgi:hypothetical protein
MTIFRDHELDGQEIGSPLNVFWCEGHGFPPDDFILEVVKYCLDYYGNVPAIAEDDIPREMWQQVVPRGDVVEYQRTKEFDSKKRYGCKPITILDLESRTSGGRKCMVNGCTNPWSSSFPMALAKLEGRFTIGITLCKAHKEDMPDYYYRMMLVPPGGKVVLTS